MKIIKNKIFQIITVLILLVGIGFIIFFNSEPVTASDNVGRGEYLTKIEEIETKLIELNNKITALENENTQLKIDLENSNKKITELEKNTELSKLTTKVSKIEDREDKLYKAIGVSNNRTVSYYMRSYKETGKEPFALSKSSINTETNN